MSWGHATTKDLVQYTNVLVGFSLDQCKDDIAMRPYIILKNADAQNEFTMEYKFHKLTATQTDSRTRTDSGGGG